MKTKIMISIFIVSLLMMQVQLLAHNAFHDGTGKKSLSLEFSFFWTC